MKSFGERMTTWLVGAVILACFGLWVWQSGREDQAVRSLAPNERAAFYERTLVTLRTTCADAREPDLGEYCRQQAEFILRMSECDDACHELVRSRLFQRSR